MKERRKQSRREGLICTGKESKYMETKRRQIEIKEEKVTQRRKRESGHRKI